MPSVHSSGQEEGEAHLQEEAPAAEAAGTAHSAEVPVEQAEDRPHRTLHPANNQVAQEEPDLEHHLCLTPTRFVRAQSGSFAIDASPGGNISAESVAPQTRRSTTPRTRTARSSRRGPLGIAFSTRIALWGRGRALPG